MSVDHHSPYTVYRDQLSALSHGLALWNPGPQKRIYDNVSIGDVGYLHEGTFIRMFNVTLPWNHPKNELLGITEPYNRLDCGPFTNTIETHFDEVVHISRFVTAESNADSLHAMAPDDIEGVTYKFRAPGALLSLPNGGRRQDAIRTKMFEDYIRDHVDKWFNWAQNKKLGVERMEDLILVTGCTLVTSWAAAAVVDNAFKAEISLTSRSLNSGGASFVWRNVRGHVSYHSSRFDPQNPPTTEDQCVFLRGFRAKRLLSGLKVIPAGSAWDDKNPQRSRRTLQIQRNDSLRNILSSLSDNSLGGSSSSLDTITSNPQRFPYPSTTTQQSNGSLYSASSSSLDMIRPPINNPQLLQYPSSTTVQNNGSLYSASFMTSPSFDTLMEVPNDVAEIRGEDVSADDNANDNDSSAH